MRRETIEIIEFLEANPHLDFWSAVKEYFSYDYFVGWKSDGSTDLKEMLKKLNVEPL